MNKLSYVNLPNNKAIVQCTCGWKSEEFKPGPFDPAEALVAHDVEHLKCLPAPPKVFYAVAKELNGEMAILSDLCEDQEKVTKDAKSMAQKFSAYHVVKVEVVSSWVG